ncbi:unnamed protein product [Larinioides sclopetarius]|uniref:Endonuclease/exonuclease/phosphatase domain-containing protein n=1 Tax=Larinioides sclopetarius TaxID=280406 RepID=A0AAV1Z7G5_9ARAC
MCLLNEFQGYDLIILGDFNSKVGISSTSKVVGNFGDEVINDNGQRLIKVCEAFGLKIQNTFFDHKDTYKYTRYGINRNGKETKSIIDFFITRQETTLHVHDVLTCRWCECRTDHVFLGETISLLSSKTSESKENVVEDVLEMRKYKTYLLYSKSFRDLYTKYLDSVIYMPNERSTQEKYDHLKEIIHSAAYDVLEIQEKNVLGEFFWDQEIKDLRAKRELPHRTTFVSVFW